MDETQSLVIACAFINPGPLLAAVQALGIALKLTVGGDNQLMRRETAYCAVVRLSLRCPQFGEVCMKSDGSSLGRCPIL